VGLSVNKTNTLQLKLTLMLHGGCGFECEIGIYPQTPTHTPTLTLSSLRSSGPPPHSLTLTQPPHPPQVQRTATSLTHSHSTPSSSSGPADRHLTHSHSHSTPSSSPGPADRHPTQTPSLVFSPIPLSVFSPIARLPILGYFSCIHAILYETVF